MKLDSIDKVRKNQKMPKEMIRYLLNENIARMIRVKSTRKLNRVLISKKESAIGKL
jgi:hypothetical protein